VVFDALVVLLVALVAGIGAWKGFAWQLGTILAPVAGFAAAAPLSPLLAPHLSIRAPYDRWAAFALVYIVATLLVHLAALAIRRRLERADLRAWDRHLGFLLGAAKGILLALLFTAAALAISEDLRSQFPATHAGSAMAQAVRTLRPALPPAASDLLAPWLELLEAGGQREKA